MLHSIDLRRQSIVSVSLMFLLSKLSFIDSLIGTDFNYYIISDFELLAPVSSQSTCVTGFRRFVLNYSRALFVDGFERDYLRYSLHSI